MCVITFVARLFFSRSCVARVSRVCLNALSAGSTNTNDVYPLCMYVFHFTTVSNERLSGKRQNIGQGIVCMYVCILFFFVFVFFAFFFARMGSICFSEDGGAFVFRAPQGSGLRVCGSREGNVARPCPGIFSLRGWSRPGLIAPFLVRACLSVETEVSTV